MKRYLTLLLFAGAGAPLFAQSLPSDAPAATPPVRLEQPATTTPTAVGTASDAAAPALAPAEATATSSATATNATSEAAPATAPATEVWLDASAKTVVADDRAKNAIERQQGDAPADAK